MRFLVASGLAILIAATAKTIDVLQTPFGSQPAPPLGLTFAISGFVIYGVGLALLFFSLAAHFALPAAAPRLGSMRLALAAVAIAARAVIAGYVPLELADGLARIVPEERTRFVVLGSISPAPVRRRVVIDRARRPRSESYPIGRSVTARDLSRPPAAASARPKAALRHRACRRRRASPGSV